MLVNFGRIVGPVLSIGAVACLAACTTGQAPPPNPSAAASLPTPGSAPVPNKKGVTIVAPYAPPQGPPEYIPPKPRGPDDGYFQWNAGHYHWDSTATNYTWLPGGFVERPYQGSVWTNGAWTLNNDQWGWTPGAWN